MCVSVCVYIKLRYILQTGFSDNERNLKKHEKEKNHCSKEPLRAHKQRNTSAKGQIDHLISFIVFTFER